MAKEKISIYEDYENTAVEESFGIPACYFKEFDVNPDEAYDGRDYSEEWVEEISLGQFAKDIEVGLINKKIVGKKTSDRAIIVFCLRNGLFDGRARIFKSIAKMLNADKNEIMNEYKKLIGSLKRYAITAGRNPENFDYTTRFNTTIEDKDKIYNDYNEFLLQYIQKEPDLKVAETLDMIRRKSNRLNNKDNTMMCK